MLESVVRLKAERERGCEKGCRFSGSPGIRVSLRLIVKHRMMHAIGSESHKY